MPDWRKLTGGVLTGVAATLAVLVVLGLVVVYSGAYDVSASSGHTPITRWAFDTTMHRSVRVRADGIDARGGLPRERVEAGASDYKSMCEHCHGGPGIDRADWAEGMLPHPPYLAKAAAEWQPEEVFWIVKHGIKMSGMPAIGRVRDDSEIWNLVAFVKQLPAMTPEQYRATGAVRPSAPGGADSSH